MNKLIQRLSLTWGILASLYGGSYALYKAFPYVGEGARIIYESKLKSLKQNSIFPADGRQKVAVFGNSKVLSGFIPELFDSLASGRVYSYNLGLPNADQFIPVLDEMISTDNTPTDIIITMPWRDPPEQNPLVFIDDDKVLIQELVPFRSFPRDLAIFIYRSRYRGGALALYRETRVLSDKVLEDRGYHFVAGQSVYPNDRLPEDFSLESDQPEVYLVRDPSFSGQSFAKLMHLLADNNIRAFIAPTYVRVHEYRADPGPNLRLRRGVNDIPYLHAVGEDYLSLPNWMFSDPLHTNRQGAAFYTAKLWELVRPYFEDEGLHPS